MADLEESYLSARTPQARRRAALAGLASLLLWLGWLRSSETFDLCWNDFEVVEPEDGPTRDLPRGLGVLGVRLGPETKSSRNKPVDMSLAYQTLSGYILENGSIGPVAVRILERIIAPRQHGFLLMTIKRLGLRFTTGTSSSTRL